MLAVWRSRPATAGGGRYLAAAWGVVCGGLMPSFFDHLAHLDRGDPGGGNLPHRCLALLLALACLLCLAGLGLALRDRDPDDPGAAGGR